MEEGRCRCRKVAREVRESANKGGKGGGKETQVERKWRKVREKLHNTCSLI